jgi:transcriptional regulator GlxA family with amidase domain
MTNPGDRRPAGPATEIVVFDGFDDLDAIAPLEVLTAAGFPVGLVRPAWQPDMVTSAHGLRLEVQATLGDCGELLLVPGGGWRDGSSVGVRAQCQTALPALLRQAHDRGGVIASVCTGAMLLAASGLLTARRAVTNRIALEDLELAGAEVHREARVVDDGSVVTCGGPAAGIDLAVHLVGRFHGPAAALEAASRLEHEPVGPVLVAGVAAA